MELKPGYKQTEVGAVPEDWEVRNLGSLCKITTGHRDVNEGNPNGQFPFFTCSRSVTYSDTYSFDTEAILIAGNGDVGTRHYYKGKFEAYQRTYVLDRFTTNIQFIDRCLEYRLIPSLSVEKIGSSIPYIKLGNLQDFLIAVPSRKEEVATITEALGNVDGLIGALEKLIAKKRDLNEAAMQQLLTGQRRLPGFTAKWEVKRLGEIGSFSKGQGIRKDELVADGIPCIRYGEIYTRHNDYIREFHSFIPAEIAEQSQRLRKGDLLFACSGETAEEIGKCVAFLGEEEAYVGGDIVILSPSAQDSLYLGYLMNQPSVSRQKARMGQGDAVVHISARNLGQLQLRLPALPEQTAIASVLSVMDAEIAALEQRRDKTRDLKQGMMQELLTGRTRLL
jgi:type I restriction enzyme S subunit